MTVVRHGTAVESQALSAAFGAHAEGLGTSATAAYAHAEGYFSAASGAYSHAEGYFGAASGAYSRAGGRGAVANKLGQVAHTAVLPNNVLASQSQYSVYTSGGTVAAANGSTLELSFLGDGTINTSGPNTSVLVIPLKSVVLVKFDVVARPNASASSAVVGACWSGSVLCARGNATGTTAGYSTGSQQNNTGWTTAPQTYSMDAQGASLTLAYSIVSTDTTNNYLKFLLSNPTSGIAWSVIGALQCVELVTTV